MELQRYLPYYSFINRYYCCRDIIHARGCREEMMTVVSLVTRQPLRVIGSAIKDNGEPRYRESEGREKKKNAHMARLILMYEMQSAAVKSAPWRGHLIGCSLLMPKNIWAVDDGSTLTRRLIAPREAQPRRRLQQRLGTDDYQCSLFLSQQSISSSC